MKTFTPIVLGAIVTVMSSATLLSAQTTVLYVDQGAGASGDGSSWAKAFRGPQGAFSTFREKSGSFEVRIAGGVYAPGGPGGDRATPFSVIGVTPPHGSTVVSVLGGFAGLENGDPDSRDPARWQTVFSGDLAGDDGLGDGHRADNSFVVLLVSEVQDLALDGLTISGGARSASDQFERGAGLTVTLRQQYAMYARTRLTNCVIRENTSGASNGAAGAVLDPGLCLIENCVIEGNHSTSPTGGAGGMRFGRSALAEVVACRISGNTGAAAGGLWSANALTLGRCLIAGNASTGHAGGVYSGGMLTAENCLIAGNRAALFGGGIRGTGVQAANCTLVDNRALNGAAVASWEISVWMVNCIVWANTPESGAAQILVPGQAATFFTCDVQGGPAAVEGPPGFVLWDRLGNIDADPLFGDPAGPDGDSATWQDNNYHLRAPSPAVNAGNEQIYITGEGDLDGLPRTVDYAFSGPSRRTDMGAYELQELPWPADFNGDGFMDGIDFDQFVPAFEGADPAADMNDDGYVDGIDYDQFMLAFEGGC